jgi:hypothetical protein
MFPWFHHARRDPGGLGIGDCTSCMKSTPRLQRQSLGCGFEPPPPSHIAVRAWDHKDRNLEQDEFENGSLKPQVCPGYVCNLPEVIEVARARMHWSKGSLHVFANQPTDQLVEGIEVLEASFQSLESAIRNKKE